MTSDLSQPEILLLHEGELTDVGALVAELGLPFVSRHGAPTPEDRAADWRLVVATPHRLLELVTNGPGSRGTRIAILQEESRTLRAMLRRAGVDYTVRRPVHPAALRLLLLHAVFRGPEQRSSERVAVGAPVRIRLGWRRHGAVLADLSITGCRLLAPVRAMRGKRVHITIPGESAGGRNLRARGKVVRCSPAGAGRDEHVVALAFESLSAPVFERLREVVRLHRAGPAVFDGPLPIGEVPPTEEVNRRRHPRHHLGRRIIALGAGAAPVLLGRDIAIGGMRVERHPDVSTGDVLQLALHVCAGDEPLVVEARVTRDDGPRGFVLEFEALEAAAEAVLEDMLKRLPMTACDSAGEESGVVVTEVLEHTPG